jgi:hypothetical protein
MLAARVSTGGASDSPGASITTARLLDHIKTLASDRYEGRAPGTAGEKLTVDYITKQFKSIGLAGGGRDGTYLQPVPLVSTLVRPTASFAMATKTLTMAWPQDLLAVPAGFPIPGEFSVDNAPVVFAGYGIVAPAYGWDDYRDADVRGKVVIVLSGVPPADRTPTRPAPDAGAPLWTAFGSRGQKIAAARQRGALALFVVYAATNANPTWDSYRHRVARTQEIGVAAATTIPPSDFPRFAAMLISPLQVNDIAAAARERFGDLTTAAQQATFHPVPFAGKASVHATRTDRTFSTSNVIAVLPGLDPILRDEVVIYTAHWDHLGRDTSLKGDQIFNGALDNAGGVAQLIEIARAFKGLHPKRTMLFIATTAEEEGLFGAKYYVANPVYPLYRTVANINLDMFWPYGRTRDVILYGAGNTTLDDIAEAAARTLGRVVVPDPEPEELFFERADQYPFAQAGVPAAFPSSGFQYVDHVKPREKDPRKEYETHDYHQVSDDLRKDWDLSGAVEDARWFLDIGWQVAQSPVRPLWKPAAPCQPCRTNGEELRRY